MWVIDREQVMAATEVVLAAVGDRWSYQSSIERERLEDTGECLYQRDGRPMCFVGFIFQALGIGYSGAWEFHSVRGVGQMLLGQHEGSFTPAAMDLLEALQTDQDNQRQAPWQEIYDARKEGL